MFFHWNQKKANSLQNLIEQYYEDLIHIVMFVNKTPPTGMDQICGWKRMRPPPHSTPPKAVWGLRATLQSLSGIKNILNDEFTWGKFTFVFFRKRHTPNSQKLITNSFPLVYFLDLFCLVTGHFFYNQEHNTITYLKEGRISFART